MTEAPLSDSRFPPELIQIGKSLDHEIRLKILAALEQSDLRFVELLNVTDRRPGALSPHLKQLQKSGMVSRVSYAIDDEVQEKYSLTSFGLRLLASLDNLFEPLVRHQSEQSTPTSSGREYRIDQSIHSDTDSTDTSVSIVNGA